jgi:hypothetical protein
MQGQVLQIDRCASIYFRLLMFTYCFQYEQSNGGSEEKLTALREIKETVEHRKHLDSSIDFIGRLIFGFENGPSVLEAVRSSGQPVVDNWDCLKSMVSTMHFPSSTLIEALNEGHVCIVVCLCYRHICIQPVLLILFCVDVHY